MPRPAPRPRFLGPLALLLAAHALVGLALVAARAQGLSAQEPLPQPPWSEWTRDVRILPNPESSTESPGLSPPGAPTSQPVRTTGTTATSPAAAAALAPPPTDSAAGRVLLHRRGCVTCHDLDVPLRGLDRGPSLRAVGLKVTATWLDQWLRDPFEYLRHSRMPRVELSPSERRDVVAWLRQPPPDLGLPVLPAGRPDPYRGRRLLRESGCQDCHRIAGEGGSAGPALDRVGGKAYWDWLYAFLKAPSLYQSGSSAHPHDLSDRDALDLSEYLSRRVRPPPDAIHGATPATSAPRALPGAPEDPSPRRGLATALRIGCVQCHDVGLKGPPLTLPAGPDRARRWLAYHHVPRGDLPPLSHTPAEAQALAVALAAPARLTGPQPLPAGYWNLPIPPQGPAPHVYAGLRAGPDTVDTASPHTDTGHLSPSACGTCHQRQYDEWSDTRHADSGSPGVWALLVDYLDTAPDFAQGCLTCHAPRAEQFETALASPDRLTLSQSGVGCTGCHVRAHQYYTSTGAPPTGASLARGHTGAHHASALPSPQLGQSQYCAPCHQFPEDGLSLGGNLVLNTLREWQLSPAAARGETCQSCHMPGGSHASTGIRDRQMMVRALDFTVEPSRRAPRPTEAQTGRQKDRLTVRIRLLNRGTGHHLPTYTTPALFVKAFLSDEHGAVLENTLTTRIVHRRLAVEEERQLFDTRIPAGGAWTAAVELPLEAGGGALNVLVEVDPDYFYRDFFARTRGKSPLARQLLDRARARMVDSSYILFARQIPLAEVPPDQVD